jgi:hypothetical protein
LVFKIPKNFNNLFLTTKSKIYNSGGGMFVAAFLNFSIFTGLYTRAKLLEDFLIGSDAYCEHQNSTDWRQLQIGGSQERQQEVLVGLFKISTRLEERHVRD